MEYQEILEIEKDHLLRYIGSIIDVIDIKKDITSLSYIKELSKILSKLSPLVANKVELELCKYLNRENKGYSGTWTRQDPGFPDIILKDGVNPAPGFEIKTWFPLSTEITARFKDSITLFADNQTYVVLLAWLPEFILFGKPKIIDICICSAKSVATARDKHYYNPPSYILLEPQDTSLRTINLQQTNVEGYKLQDPTADQLRVATEIVANWGDLSTEYKTDIESQLKIVSLSNSYKYRLDTNFSKIDRIEHHDIEAFKQRVLNTSYHGIPIQRWGYMFNHLDDCILDLLHNLA